MTPCRCSFVFNPAGLRWAGFAPRPNPAEDGPSRPRSAPPHGLEGGQPWRQERYGPWLGRLGRLGPLATTTTLRLMHCMHCCHLHLLPVYRAGPDQA